jgi:NhaP-type Na+/H+ or K+/H+ antiporter
LEVAMAPFAALLAVVLTWGLVSERLARYSITLPIVLVAMGAVLSATHVVVVQLDTESVRTLVELALSILLFADATEISAKWLRSAGQLPLRMLALGFPLTVATGFAIGHFLLPGAGVWVVALLAAALAATDAALASPVIMDERIPRRLRRIIDVESGLNDGLATPLVLFFLAGAVASGGAPEGDAPLVHALVELAVGLAVGVVIGAGGARLLVSARRTSWSSAAGERLAVLILPVLTYLAATALGGNGFVAAFVAGIAAGTVAREEVAEKRLQLTNDVGTLVSAAVWFVFGSLFPDVVARGVSWNVLLYAVLSLTLVRLVPVALALARSGLDTREVLFLGWIGPRGLASILFGLIAIEDLHAHGLTAAADLVAEVIVVTVSLSVLLHGLTAGVIAARWPADRAMSDPTRAGAGQPESRKPST